jgi:hypothetical protein
MSIKWLLVSLLGMVVLFGCVNYAQNWDRNTFSENRRTLLVQNETGNHFTIRAHPSRTRIGVSITQEECFDISRLSPSDRVFSFSATGYVEDHLTPIENLQSSSWVVRITAYTDTNMIHSMNTLKPHPGCDL